MQKGVIKENPSNNPLIIPENRINDNLTYLYIHIMFTLLLDFLQFTVL